MFQSPSSITKENCTPEIQHYCSFIGSSGPILKFSELFGPVLHLDQFHPRKKPKSRPHHSLDVYEPNEEEIFRSKPSAQDQDVPDVDMMETPHQEELDARPLRESYASQFDELKRRLNDYAFQPIEQRAWEEQIIWENTEKTQQKQHQTPKHPVATLTTQPKVHLSLSLKCQLGYRVHMHYGESFLSHLGVLPQPR